MAVFIVSLAAKAQSYIPELTNQKIRVKPKIEIKAYAFNLRDVRLLEGSPFKNAMDKDAAYLLVIEPDRLLHRFHKNAGLPVKGEVYGGWESEGLSGHSLGHYLSACALFYAATGNEEFKKRVDYITNELEICQTARKTGYVGAIPNEDSIFAKLSRGEIKSGGFDLNGGWAPWYTVHKVMAGLLDAYLYCHNEKALKIATRMADWVETILKDLSREQLLKMLNCEYGGIAEVLANIYSITGNKKYLEISYKFRDEFVMGQLAKKINPMPGKHSNTNVPKAIGAARQYELTKNVTDSTIATFFWDIMVYHHTYVIGGNSNYEYCGEPDHLNDQLSDNTCETCNTYNMLKLTRHLFAWEPNSKYIDYSERALYNHILASQNPDDGMMCYFVPLRMGAKKEFSDPFNTFTCCVGSGMENHSKYAEGIFSETKEGDLLVNLYIPAELNWQRKHAKIRLQTDFPYSDKVKMQVGLAKAKTFTISFRKPNWLNNEPKILLNGQAIEFKTNANGYIDLNRKWANKDSIEITLPMRTYSESMPDNKDRIAFLHGPVVLAAQLGDTMPEPSIGVPVLLTDNKNIDDWLKTIDIQNLIFRTAGIGKPFDTVLAPFFSTHKQYYSVYFDYFTLDQWESRKAAYETEKKRQQEIEEKTIDYFRIGEMQPERDHNLTASEQSYVDRAFGRAGREARRANYFSFEMKVNPHIPNSLLLTYLGDDKNRKFDIMIDGSKIAYVEWDGGTPGRFYDHEYPIPVGLIDGKSKITVRIEANYDRTAGRIFGCRTLKSL